MRRLMLAISLVAMLLLTTATPAMANEWDDSNWWNYNTDSEWYDELCSPGLSDGIYVPGCIFSDAGDEDFFFSDQHDWDWDHRDRDHHDWDRWDWD